MVAPFRLYSRFDGTLTNQTKQQQDRLLKHARKHTCALYAETNGKIEFLGTATILNDNRTLVTARHNIDGYQGEIFVIFDYTRPKEKYRYITIDSASIIKHDQEDVALLVANQLLLAPSETTQKKWLYSVNSNEVGEVYMYHHAHGNHLQLSQGEMTDDTLGEYFHYLNIDIEVADGASGAAIFRLKDDGLEIIGFNVFEDRSLAGGNVNRAIAMSVIEVMMKNNNNYYARSKKNQAVYAKESYKPRVFFETSVAICSTKGLSRFGVTRVPQGMTWLRMKNRAEEIKQYLCDITDAQQNELNKIDKSGKNKKIIEQRVKAAIQKLENVKIPECLKIAKSPFDTHMPQHLNGSHTRQRNSNNKAKSQIEISKSVKDPIIKALGMACQLLVAWCQRLPEEIRHEVCGGDFSLNSKVFIELPFAVNTQGDSVIFIPEDPLQPLHFYPKSDADWHKDNTARIHAMKLLDAITSHKPTIPTRYYRNK